MENENNIGDLFREAFKDFERKPSEKIWNNIENNTNTDLIPKNKIIKPAHIYIGATVIAVILLVAYFMFMPTKQQTATPVAVLENTKTINNQNSSNTSANIENKAVKADYPSDKSQINAKTVDNTQNNVAKRININDLIAQTETQQYNTNETVNPISTTSISQKQHKTPDKQSLADNSVISARKNVVEIKFPADQQICKGDKTQLSITGGVTYLWSTGETTQSIIVAPAVSTDYSVAATDENGIKKVGLISVIVSDCNAIFVPKAFSPDGDGQNDVFKAYGNAVVKFEMTIIARGGQLVFTSKDINEGWDGTYKGKAMHEGVYGYSIRYTNELNKEQTVTGHITLIR